MNLVLLGLEDESGGESSRKTSWSCDCVLVVDFIVVKRMVRGVVVEVTEEAAFVAGRERSTTVVVERCSVGKCVT